MSTPTLSPAVEQESLYKNQASVEATFAEIAAAPTVNATASLTPRLCKPRYTQTPPKAQVA